MKKKLKLPFFVAQANQINLRYHRLGAMNDVTQLEEVMFEESQLHQPFLLKDYTLKWSWSERKIGLQKDRGVVFGANFQPNFK